MPTKRRKIAPARHGIRPEAIEAWQAGDYWTLHRALGLNPWQMPDWECDPPEQLQPGVPGPDTTALKVALVAMAGPPPKRWRMR
jgi:hypothetical protein